MDIEVLKIELTTDPLVRGYAGMTDAEVAIDLNTVYQTSNKAVMTGSEVFNAVDKAEFNALSDVNKQTVWNILHLGDVNPFGIEADLFIDIFDGGSITIANLQGLRKNNISRASELGIGVVKEGYVEQVRT